MSIDAVHYQAPKGARPQTLSPFFLRTEPAALMIARRGSRLSTYHQAVERVIHAIHERLEEPLTLQDMAEIALLSPYHFNRVFRHVTGIPPGKFQAALRIQAAKRLLVTTDISVTEICFMVGYNSLGTFTSNFTELVGMSPSQLRQRAKQARLQSLELLAAPTDWHEPHTTSVPGWTVQGAVACQEIFSGPILVGLFDSPIPESQPVACTVVSKAGFYQIQNVPRGEYHVLVAAFDPCRTGVAELLQDRPCLVGKARETVSTDTPRTSIKANVLLRPAQTVDPPILVALSFLLNERLKQLKSGESLVAGMDQGLGLELGCMN